MEKIKSFFYAILGIVVLGGGFVLSSDIIVTPPDNALVVLSHTDSRYLVPPCMNQNFDLTANPTFEISTLKKAREMGYTPDNCAEHALHPSRSVISHYLLEPIGVVKPLDRWDKDGKWLY